VKRRVAAAALVSAPFLVILLREAGKLLAGPGSPAAPMAGFWIFLALIVLAMVWSTVYFLGRKDRAGEEKLPFGTVAAIAMAELQKRGPAARCASCGRPWQFRGGSKCLYCGSPAAAAGGAAEPAPAGRDTDGGGGRI
jgi:hypothetical protein